MTAFRRLISCFNVISFQLPVSPTIIFLILITLTMACRSSDSRLPQQKTGKSLNQSRGPKKVYVPEYYVYRRGKYAFVKGHYRWVIFPKVYAKRSLKGYVTPVETAKKK